MQHIGYFDTYYDIWELRAIADFVLTKQLKLLFNLNQVKSGIASFESHYQSFKKPYKHYPSEFRHLVN